MPPLRRRLATLVLALPLGIGLVACGGDDAGTPAEDAELMAPAPTGEVPLPETTPEGAPPGVDAPLAGGARVEVPLRAAGGGAPEGSATLIPVGQGLTRVVVRLPSSPAGPRAAHLHRGTCAGPVAAPVYALERLRRGASESFLPVSLATLRASPFALDVHASADGAGPYVACGEVPS